MTAFALTGEQQALAVCGLSRRTIDGMRLRVAATAIACLAVAGVSGCSHGQSCAVVDYDGEGAGGYQTPWQALNSVLALHEQWLSTSGWVLKDQGAQAVTFVSGNNSVDVVKTTAGKWVVGGVTACQ